MKWVWIGLIAVLFLFISVRPFMERDPDARERQIQAAAIAECRSRQNDSLTDVEQRRIIRDACDSMETKYREKWGQKP